MHRSPRESGVHRPDSASRERSRALRQRTPGAELPRVSVVIPVLDAAATLARCLEGLQDQDHPAHEILVVDNGSRDASADIAAGCSGVRALRQERPGAYAARNRALESAAGSIVAFTDPDCVPGSAWLRELTEPFSAEEVLITIGRASPAGGSLALRTLRDYEHSRNSRILNGEDSALYQGHTNNMAVRRELFDELGPFVERRRGADIVFVQRCVERYGCESVRYVPEAEVVHLEIDRLSTFYRKVYTYGWSAAGYSRLVPKRVLDRAERWRMFRGVCREHGYGAMRGLLLLLLLGAEGVAWKLGTWRAALAGGAEPSS